MQVYGLVHTFYGWVHSFLAVSCKVIRFHFQQQGLVAGSIAVVLPKQQKFLLFALFLIMRMAHRERSKSHLRHMVTLQIVLGFFSYVDRAFFRRTPNFIDKHYIVLITTKESMVKKEKYLGQG